MHFIHLKHIYMAGLPSSHAKANVLAMSANSIPSNITPVKRARLTRAFLQLKRLAQSRQNHIKLDTIITMFGQDGLLIINTLFAFLNVILSFLHGISLPLGIIQIIIMIAIIRGKTTFWLPQKIRRYKIKPQSITKKTERWLPFLYGLERISHPRMERFMRHALTRQATIWLLFLLAIIVAAPIPFMNITPSIGVILISIGLLNYDVLIWLCGLLVIAAHSALYFIWGWFWPHITAWYDWLL
jgi:hypothetical protein